MIKKTLSLDYDAKFQNLITLSGIVFLFQFLLFLGLFVLIIANRHILSSAANGEWDQMLIHINNNPTQFLWMRVLFIVLRTCYSISFLGLGFAFLKKHQSLVPILFVCITLAVAMINLGSLYQITLLPLSNRYVQAVMDTSIQAITSYEITAQTIYTMTEYADLFVNLGPFLGVFICWFIMIYHVPFFTYTKWAIPIIAVLPLNRFVQLSQGLNLGLGLLNIVGTVLIFISTGIYLLKIRPTT